MAPKFSDTIARYPVFGADAVDGLTDYLRGRLPIGQGKSVLDSDRAEQLSAEPQADGLCCRDYRRARTLGTPR